MLSQKVTKEEAPTPEDGVYMFQMFHGSAQQNGGYASEPAGTLKNVAKAMRRELCSATEEDKTTYDGIPTLYLHSAESAGGYEGEMTYEFILSHKGNPNVINPTLLVTHIDRYFNCKYVQKGEAAHVEIPKLCEPEKCWKLYEPTSFVNGVHMRLGLCDNQASHAQV